MVQAMKCPTCEKIKPIDPQSNPFYRNGEQYCSRECLIGSGAKKSDIAYHSVMKQIVAAKVAKKRKARTA